NSPMLTKRSCASLAVSLTPALADTSYSLGGPAPITLQLKSSDFASGEKIPKQFTCEGADISPALSWNDPPSGTKSFALIVDDPDAPVGDWVHWVVYNLPVTLRALPQNFAKTEQS